MFSMPAAVVGNVDGGCGVAANDKVLAANRLDRLRQTELVWLHRDIERLPQEFAGPGTAARH